MTSTKGSLRPFVTVNRSAELYNTVSYPSGGNVGSANNAVFVATFGAGVNLITVPYVISGQILPGMALSGIGIAAGTYIVGPLNQQGYPNGGVGQYTTSLVTTTASSSVTVTSGTYNSAGSVISATSFPQNYPQGPGGIVGPIPGFNCANIMDIRDYYNLPYPPATPLASPPVIAVVSFGGGIYGQPVTTGQYAGFWRCTDISGNNGAPIQILVAPINGAINAPNADDGGATLENTVDVATVNAFYGMIDPRRDAPIYTQPIIILYIAPSSDISEMYRTFYTVLKNPVVCNGRSYLPTVVSCSWGAPEIAWSQKMAFPPNPSIPVDNDPNPDGIAELNEINDLFAEATKDGINICCASGDIPLTTVNASVNQYNFAQALLLQGAGCNTGNPPGQIPQPQLSVFPLTNAERASLPAPQVMFPASSPYVTCVGGSAVYFPTINTGSYANPAEFAWDRANGGISTVFSIPAYQQNQPGAAATSAAQFLASSLNTANLAQAALGTPLPNGGQTFPDPISGGITAPNTAVTLATQTKDAAYESTLAAFNAAQAALQAAQASAMDDALTNSLIQTVKDASTALATAKASRDLADDAFEKAQDLVVKTQTVSSLLVTAGTVFGAAAAVSGAEYNIGATYETQQAVLDAQLAAQQASYTQLVTPSTSHAIALQQKNEALQAAQAAAASTSLAATTLPAAVDPSTAVANKAVSQAAAAVVAPSLSAHPYLQFEPYTSPLVPKSNLAYDTAHTVAATVPYDSTAMTAPSYLLTTLGTGYQTPGSTDPSGTEVMSVRSFMNTSITKADLLVDTLVNTADYWDSSGNKDCGYVSCVGQLTDSTIASAHGQLSQECGDPYVDEARLWKCRANMDSSTNEMIPSAGTSLCAHEYAHKAYHLAKDGAASISNYESGLAECIDGHGLPCGLASTAATVLAAVYPVTQDELEADIEVNPFGITTDVDGNTVTSGAYNGITPPLINLRNIYVNTTLMTRRATTAVKAAKDSKQAFLAWHSANEEVSKLKAEATDLYGNVPAPSNDAVYAMDAKLLAAKTKLSSATYALGVAENYAVTTARLAHQSSLATSVFMGNLIATSDDDSAYDQLGNVKPVDGIDGNSITGFDYQGQNNENCPLIGYYFDASGTIPGNALIAAQALAQAAANDTYYTKGTINFGIHSINGQDTVNFTPNVTSLTGTLLLVEDAQYAAAGASAQVANVAFSDASESMARFTDWHNVSLAANAANWASQKVYLALTDASGGSACTQGHLRHAVDKITRTVTLLVSAITPFNQQATPSATVATNDVVALAAKLDNAKNVCLAAQAAIQLAASTYDASGPTNISGSNNSQGGSIFTVNMAYAKVTADAAQAACTAAAILAREQAVLAARRTNYSALALKKLVGDSVIGEAIAGFVDASGNIVSQTGYGPYDGDQYPLRKAPGYDGTNGYYPPAVTTATILYQGQGGLDLSGLELEINPQPSIITNLTYNGNEYDDVYSATSALVEAAQQVLSALDSDSSGNCTPSSQLELLNPNVNAVNALDSRLGSTPCGPDPGPGDKGYGLYSVQQCLLAAYEAQQWVVASANATFVTIRPPYSQDGPNSQNLNNQNIVNFVPTLLGVVNKLASDADACLDTVLSAEAAILYALSQRQNKLLLHDVGAANFAAAFNANQSAADTYLALTNAATLHDANTRMTIHQADIANGLSPLAAAATTAAAQAAALGGMAFSAPTPNPNLPATDALRNANFPNNFSNGNANYAAGGWSSASMPVNGYSAAGQTTNSLNPNFGPFNGTATGLAPFPAFNASSSSRIPSPAAQVLQYSSQLLNWELSNAALATARSAAAASQSSTDFNTLMVKVSTVTPSLVDAATSACNLTLEAAQLANYATSLETQGQIYPNQASLNTTANLLEKEYTAILAAKQSAQANLEAISSADQRYASRKNMLDLWNIAVNAAAAVVDASDGSPTDYPAGTDPSNIQPASLGTVSIMGTTNSSSWSGSALTGNSAPYYYVKVANVELGSMETVVYTTPGSTSTSVSQPSLLAQLNAAVINAYNATSGAPDASGNYTFRQFLDNSGNIISNFPEDVNDTLQAYNNAVAALRANAAVAKSSIAAVQAAALRIQAAYDAAVAVAESAPNVPFLDASGNYLTSQHQDPSGHYVKPTAKISTDVEYFCKNTRFTAQQAAAQVAVAFWNSANEFVSNMLVHTGTTYPNLTLVNMFKLQAIVGLNFTQIVPNDTSSEQRSYADAANVKQQAMMHDWSLGLAAKWGTPDSSGNPAYGPTNGYSLSTYYATNLLGLGDYLHSDGYYDASGSHVDPSGNKDFLGRAGIATGIITDTSGNYSTPTGWGAYYWTKAVSVPGNQASGVALQAATDAWNSVETLLNTFIIHPTLLNTNAANANKAKAKAVYSVKLALQAAAAASASAQASANASNALGTATNSYEDLAAYAASEAAYASTANLNMYRCVPDIAMHADADDLPVIFRLNGSAVYVGGTSIAASMFAGFLGVVQSHNSINYFVNPLLYDNYTFPSPLFNDISGSSQVWYTGSVGGATVPSRIANVLPGLPSPRSGLGSGLYNLNVGLGSIKGMNLAALMEVPHLVTKISPYPGDSASVTVYPGTSSTITVYVEPVTAYNPFVTWSCNSSNATVSQTNGPTLSNNGMNDTDPYTPYNPLQHDNTGTTLVPTPSSGNYGLGSVGNAVLGLNPYHKDCHNPDGYPCFVFSATVTGVTAVPSSAPLPIITVSSTDGSSVYGSFKTIVLPAVQVTGVSISLENRMTNPANTTLFLGTTLQLLANVTPLNATNQRVFWWSSNSSVVNVDVNGLMTSLAPGQVTIKATSLNNNISASISVYVPTPITGLDVLPRSITLNPNMQVYPLKNSGLIRAIVQPAEADYKHLTWEIVSSTQLEPAPAGISSVISLPRNGTVLARSSNGDITDNTQASVTAISNGTAVIKVSTYGEPYGVYGTYTAMVTVNVVTPVTDIVMTQTDMVINLNPETAKNPVFPESYQVTATFKPAYPSNMNVFWSSSNPKVAVVSNNSPPVLNTTVSDPNFGLWQITETISPLSNGTTVIKVTSADCQKTSMTTVVVTTPVTGLSMSALPIVLNPTRDYNLQATVLPVTATNKTVVWESTNTAIATVDNNGVVHAITSGSCGITATTEDGDYTAIAKVNVVTPLVGVQLLVNTPLPIHINDVVQILVVMVPTIATNQLFTWTVTDGPSGPIFTTGPPQNGNIVFLDAVQSGNAVFTVTSADGNKQASINLQVVNW